MQLIPAIDLKDGKCVRLTQGDIKRMDVFSDDPVSVAKKWESLGASIIHVVDLDGAFTGNTLNLETIKKILDAVKIPIQLGGGIRSFNTIEKYIKMGISRVVIGTAAVKNPKLVKEAVELYGERIIVGIDARDEKVTIKGWVETSPVNCYELAREMEQIGIKRIIFTDVSKDGMMEGPNIKSIKKMLKQTTLKIIASGGISSIEDIMALKQIDDDNLEGVIVGKALYTQKIDYKRAQKLLEEGD